MGLRPPALRPLPLGGGDIAEAGGVDGAPRLLALVARGMPGGPAPGVLALDAGGGGGVDVPDGGGAGEDVLEGVAFGGGGSGAGFSSCAPA